MRHDLLLAALLIAALFCSCMPEQHVEVDNNSQLVEMYLNASLVSSKANLDSDMLTPLWQEGDELAVYDGVSLRSFQLVSGAGTTSASFRGQADAAASTFTAVYPYSAAKLSNGEVTYSIPSSQSAAAPGADPSALVMQATAARGATLKFSNLTSLLRFSAPASVTNVVFFLGDYQVSMDLPGVEGTYAIAIKPGEYSSVKALITTADGKYIMESINTLKIDRGHSISMGVLSLKKNAITISTAKEMADFLKSTSSSDKTNVLILNDINMAGTYWTSASGFAGNLDGNGCTVTISGASGPMFESNNGSISSLTIAGTMTPSGPVSASLVKENRGPLTNITNKVSVSYSTSQAIDQPVVIGGIVAYNYYYGRITSCVNQGAVSFSSTSSVKGVALGGIAGYNEALLRDSRNEAPVYLSFKYGSGMCQLGKIPSSAASLGGIVGAGWDGCRLSNCTNSGAVTYLNNAIENCPEAYQRVQIGGIAGSPYGPIMSCTNSGNIKITATTSSRTAFSARNYILNIGGISGGSFHETADYQASNDHTSITSCSNEGNIVIDFDANASNSPVGGIVGWPNGEKTNIGCKTSNCTNSGDITMSGAGKVRIGGVMGGTGALENCTNSGRIHVKSADSGSAIGGINAFHSQDHALYACVNTGDVVSDVTLFGVGGLIGCHGGVNLTSSLSCKVLCDVISAAPNRSNVGMVLGTYNKETTKNVVLGSPQEPIEVKGHIHAGGIATELNENNFTSYLSGTAYLSATHIIYAQCTTTGPGVYAEGTVKYDDGTPAVGVSVSDGFTVAVTDANGYYRLATCPDTWYIYISLPSDAVVQRKSDGRPDFFINYGESGSGYNFTLKRQPVENEFMLFALADPQAHNSDRGTGKSDTNRFRDESVPAVNSVIAQQSVPCYGVTLGDIVYSEGARNSSVGMTTMRSHFSLINMPVFQTIGNHDYTYFYANSPLELDSRSSNLYLRAQRKFEEVFGPINYSFNRGDVHVVCMRNIIFSSATDASSYHCGYTDEQFAWLQADLANVPKTKMVILCGHIPLVGCTGNEHVSDVINLLKQYKSPQIFSGHTHYKRYVVVSGIPEHIHSAVCGTWWWGNVEGDGVPNGYTVYHVKGTSFIDEFFMGVNNQMNTRSNQIRVYRGNLTNGGYYAKFKWPHESSRLLINIFNGDSRWKVKVYENGVLTGPGNPMSYSRQTFGSITTGTTYTVDEYSSNDWWAVGYLIGVVGRGLANTSYYTSNFHMYTYNIKNPDATIRVEAVDGYGNTYSCSEIIDTDSYYPNYMRFGNVN